MSKVIEAIEKKIKYHSDALSKWQELLEGELIRYADMFDAQRIEQGHAPETSTGMADRNANMTATEVLDRRKSIHELESEIKAVKNQCIAGVACCFLNPFAVMELSAYTNRLSHLEGILHRRKAASDKEKVWTQQAIVNLQRKLARL